MPRRGGSWSLVVVWLVGMMAAGCGDEPGPAGPQPGPAPIDTVPSPPEEGRAVWLSRWDWYDRADLESLIDDVAAANFNIIYLQVRGRSDAYYASALEPWAHRPPLFVLGQDPGWDPLGVAVERARMRGLEVHAWLNALIGWCTSEPIPVTTPAHVLVEHPDWVMVSATGATTAENCTFLTPGEPGVRRRLAAAAAEIAREYPVAGVHLDYIRYPNPDFSYDSASEATFAAALEVDPELDYDDFRRGLVTATVREVGDSVAAVDPALRMSAAVWGVYRNTWGWSNVAPGYDTRFQDSRGWAEAGLVDVIAPMIYWRIASEYGGRLDFAALADEFVVNAHSRHVYVGMGVEAPSEGFCTGCDVVRQIYRARRAGADGVSVFSARLLREAGLWDDLREGPFKEKVPVPAMPWLPDAAATVARPMPVR